jgi:signal peptidase I
MKKVDISTVKGLKTYGSSMLPILRDGDFVYIRKITFFQLKINDIVVIKVKNLYMTHRIIYVSPTYIVTKGDNNRKSDGKIYPNQIVGKIYKIKRGNKIYPLETLYMIQSSYYMREIRKINTLFTSKRIDFVFLKGLPIYLHYFKTIPHKLYADCDLLINRSQLKIVDSIMKKCGYIKLIDPLFNVDEKSLPELSYVLKGSKVPVVFDIHLEPVFLMTKVENSNLLYPRDFLDALTVELLSNKQYSTNDGLKYPILDSQYLVLYLLLHFFHHNFNDIRRLELVDFIVRKEGVKKNTDDFWKTITEAAYKYRLKNYIYPSLILLKKHFQTPIPSKLLASFKPGGLANLYISKRILSHFSFTDQNRTQSGIERFTNIFFLSDAPYYMKVVSLFNKQIILTAIASIQMKSRLSRKKLIHDED